VKLATPNAILPRWLKIALFSITGLLLTLVILVSAVVAVLRSDPAKLEAVLEAVASRILNRDLQIGEIIAADLDWDTYLLARDVSLANPEWAETPDFIRIEHFLIRINIPSIWQDGPVLIEKLELANTTLNLLAPEDHPPNWDFWPVQDAGEIIETSDLEEDEAPNMVLPVLISDGYISNGEINYHGQDHDVSVEIDKLGIQEPPQGGLTAVDLAGVINGIPLKAVGHLGPTSALLTLKNLDLDLTVNWGQLEVVGLGTIEDLKSLSGVNLRLKVTAPHSRPLLDLLNMPEVDDGPLHFEGQVSDARPGIAVNVAGTLGKQKLSFLGKLTTPLELDGVDMAITLEGSSLAEIGAMFELEGLPAIPYAVSGEIYRHGSTLGVRKGRVSAGDSHLFIEGFVPDYPGIDDWQVTLAGSNLNLALLGPLIGAEDLPKIPYDIEGTLESTDEGVELMHLRINSAESSLLLNGRVNQGPSYLGSHLELDYSGSSLASSGLWLGLLGLPDLAFTLKGELSYSDSGWRLENARFSTPDLQLDLSGEVNKLPEPTRLSANLAFNSPNLPEMLNKFGWQIEALADFPVTANIQVSGSPDNIKIERATIESDDSRIELAGMLGDPTSLAGLNLDVGVVTPDLLRFLTVMGEGLQPRLPLEASGKVSMSSAGILVEGVEAQLAEMQLTLSGLVFPVNTEDKSHITVEANTADLGEILAPWIEYDISTMPFHLSLDASYQSGTLRVERLDAKVADNRLNAQIDFDNPADLYSAHGKIQLTGSSTQELAHLLGVDTFLEDTAYSLTIGIENTSEFLHLKPISLIHGKSVVSGNVSIMPGDNPTINVDLYSKFLDISFLLPNFQELEQEEAARINAGDTFDEAELFEDLTTQELAERVIPREPLDFNWLRNLQGSFKFQLDNIYLQEDASTSATIDISIANGLLSSRQLNWNGKFSAGNAELSIRALDTGNEFQLYFDAQRLPLILMMGGEPEDQPGSFYRARMTATGNNLREMAKSANGTLIFQAGGGNLDNHGLDLVLGDVLDEITSRLNPYSESDKRTRLVCHAGALTIKDGKVLLAPGMVLRGDKMDIALGGTLNLHNEKLNLAFSTRSRKGIGISASKAITPYFKIGGTLANPRLVLDVKGATVSGGAAVATGGLSIIADGLWDRWVRTAGNPCARLITQASKQNDKTYESLLLVTPQ